MTGSLLPRFMDIHGGNAEVAFGGGTEKICFTYDSQRHIMAPVTIYTLKRRPDKMKKVYLLVVMAMMLCLTACGTNKRQEALENSISVLETETTTDTKKNPEEPSGEMETTDSAGDEQKSQQGTETAFELTEQGKEFLAQMCRELNDFNSQTTKDETFWRDFLFYSYTGAFEGVETEEVYREDLGFDETVVKISLEEAEAYAKLVFGIDLPDIKPSFEDMEQGQTSFFYQNGYYYIGVSDFPDYQYAFADYEESGDFIRLLYTVDFEGESNIGTVCFEIIPEDNENGFIITSKSTEIFN